MAYLNKVMLIGNLGKDPYYTNTPSGKSKVSFPLATSRRYRDNNGETKEQTYWHNVVGWGKICDIMKQLDVSKGMSLYVEGTLTNRQFEDKNSWQKQFYTEIILDSLQVLTNKQNNGNYQSTPTSYNNQSPAERQYGTPSYDDDEIEDLPF